MIDKKKYYLFLFVFSTILQSATFAMVYKTPEILHEYSAGEQVPQWIAKANRPLSFCGRTIVVETKNTIDIYSNADCIMQIKDAMPNERIFLNLEWHIFHVPINGYLLNIMLSI